MQIDRILEEIISLPLDERIRLVESIMESMNPIDLEIQEKWIEEVKRRRESLRAGKTHAIPGDEVFARLRNRLSA